ncbi:SUMF1/EgtB/PvdO family nonheme iron enzyme [Verrucomicrobiaceae bacterium N1E253]|uniref:SUMF1/EgtB/PvdO family nonheme iron enzyme n=1 Tax=Oceaniferula marina TaxID=2748318 RepID=A0A851GC33_9BACT|nr:SUMF1/EgtB/PvdO family nonheme iron enzyme [Oceaniferula marina]NWK54739.1 SUMF1/EgtB/PvdO family nonheme iron enzyme [Oceaniferula marina]
MKALTLVCGVLCVPGLGGLDAAESEKTKPLPRVRTSVPFKEVIKVQTWDEQLLSLQRAIEDMEAEHGNVYDGEKYLAQLSAVRSIGKTEEGKKSLALLQRRALLSNPALDFENVLLVRRSLPTPRDRTSMGAGIGMTAGNFSSMWNAKKNLPSEIGVLEGVRKIDGDRSYRMVYQHDKNRLISDLDLHFDADKIMFSSVNASGAFRLYEVGVDGKGLSQLTPDADGKDVDHFDSCYLPDGDIIFTSTASFCGMPCIDGKPRMSSIYRLSPEQGKIRQLSFDQDSSWCPTVHNDGRVLYLRWEYSDLPHSNSRILMSMNPDGTSQKSYLFTNSYFPTSFFYARPIPGHASKVVGIATGHHGNSRTGRMLIVDPNLGEHEADGVVQEVPGYGKKVEPIIRDRLADGIWPQITQPYPLAQSGSNKGAGKYFLVSMKPSPEALWGIYLVDIFDNRTLLMEQEGYGFFEPIPLKKSPTPPVLAERVNESKNTASVYIQDIYHGPGLKGVPRGEVKELQVCSYEFSPSSPYPGKGSGGLLGTLGMDGPWDIKKVLGTVPVNADGSVHFTIPANTPIFLLPLDKDGQALQLMRSWFIGQPGERVSCVGCHESSHESPLPKMTEASKSDPLALDAWLAKVENFSYPAKVQPIVDRHCMGCHDGQPADGRYVTQRHDYQKKAIPYLGADLLKDWRVRYSGSAHPSYGGRFSEGYFQLFRMARGPGIESDMALLTAKEFSADSTELVQMLKKGHHGVSLSEKEWRTIYQWIDLNTPYHGNRMDVVKGLPVAKAVEVGMKRSNELAEKYSKYRKPFGHTNPTMPKDVPKRVVPDQKKVRDLRMAGTLEFASQVGKEQKQPITLDLGGGQSIRLVYIPAGHYTMGSAAGGMDELPMHKQEIKRGFWMAEAEITNAQMRQFDDAHHSRAEDRHGYQFGQPCYDVNGDALPAVRVSWKQAMEFCDWLAKKTGKQVKLPSEVQWEWACRAGQGTPFSYGDTGADFSTFANLADKSLEDYVDDTAKGKYRYFETVIMPNPNRYEAHVPYVAEIDDGGFLAREPKQYQANPWGLYDMHGNVAEWTRSVYQPYPLIAGKGGDADKGPLRVVRGGSWRDRPHRATSSFRLAYPDYQKVYNVGFRVVIE